MDSSHSVTLENSVVSLDRSRPFGRHECPCRGKPLKSPLVMIESVNKPRLEPERESFGQKAGHEVTGVREMVRTDEEAQVRIDDMIDDAKLSAIARTDFDTRDFSPSLTAVFPQTLRWIIGMRILTPFKCDGE
jgi:hypothetical protein